MKKYRIITKYKEYIFFADRKRGNKYATTFYNVRYSKEDSEPRIVKQIFYKVVPFTVEEL